VPLRYHALKDGAVAEVEHRYDARDTILYALGLGYGDDPVDPRQLRHVQDRGLVALPTLATVLGYPFMWFEDPRFGLDGARIVHAGHALRVHAPLPVAGTVRGVTRATVVCDKGADRGALIVLERTLSEAAGGRLLATQAMTLMARGDGGFSAVEGNGPAGGDAHRAERADLPQRAPDAVLALPTLPQAALIYRLVADPNPLHADPAFARDAGFERPILHGLCAYGMAARALARAFLDEDATRLRALALRFAAPVFPGDTLRFELWRDGAALRFRADVPARGGVVVLDQGQAEAD
jgi:acyl dehydratase